jgi:hypothetical protein
VADCIAAINDDENWKKAFENKAKKLFVSVDYKMINN